MPGAALGRLERGEPLDRRREQHRPGDRRGRLALDVDRRRVLLEVDLVAGLELALGEHLVPREHLDGARLDQPRQRVRRLAQVGQAARLGLGVPLLGVVVAVEDDPLVGRPRVLDRRRRRVLERGAAAVGRLELVGQVVDRLGDDRVEHRVRERQRHRGAERAELELVAREGERRGPVAVAAVHRQRRQHGGAELEVALRGLAVARAALDRLEDLLQLGAEEDRDDRRRRLVGAEAVVLAGVGDRRAQQLLVVVDGLDDGRAEEQELQVLVRRLARARAG